MRLYPRQRLRVRDGYRKNYFHEGALVRPESRLQDLHNIREHPRQLQYRRWKFRYKLYPYRAFLDGQAHHYVYVKYPRHAAEYVPVQQPSWRPKLVALVGHF